jgi:hypothetical protein
MQMAELYMVMGGVPHYLKQVDPGLSATQVIDRVCFSPEGLLREEFDPLFASLFDKSSQHRAIVRMLAKKRRGLTRNEILTEVGLKSGGSATTRLDELEASGFISQYIPYGKKTKDALYRLSDEYSLFYLDWIRRQGNRSLGDGYWSSQQNAPRRRAWAGYAFEGLCIKHTRQLKRALGISGVETTEAPWRHQSQKGESSPGAEIDLLIDRRDQTINLCEMKFTESTFTIDRRYADDLRRKLSVFREITRTRKNVFLTMVTTFGVTDNPYAKELVSKSITLPELFRE